MYSLYLSHHGVKGQKWGIRHISDIDTAKSNARKRYVELFAKEAIA